MRKLSTKVRRVLVLTAMFVVMASIPVMAAIEYHDYMDTEHWVQNSREQVGDYCRMSSN